MDNKSNAKPSIPELSQNGIFIQGVVISTRARKITKKDGGIMALVQHEVALQPGMAVLDEFLDPKGNPEVTIEGDTVIKYPKFPEFKTITVKANRLRENNGNISVASWDIV